MKEQISQEIVDYHPNYISSKWILERIPFIFNDDLDQYIDWKERLGSYIGVDAKAIAITGSAAVGISLNPDKDFREFTEKSDIDVAIVSGHHFDISWHYLRNLGPKRHRLKRVEKESVKDHRERLIYWGTIATDKIIQILPFGKEWMNAIDQMRKIDPTKDRDINFRIYKDFESLREYQSDCIGKLKDIIIST
ncbi:hypothetical protein [uncultured Christiangramia sp.]|uniref:hypothetical protein n=1 Tax=uncultured Christiangramia sp. TaxID=503836 RepID=UPI00262A2CAD|nr:hypothetical protein [uncultured Christiangramia sp.]